MVNVRLALLSLGFGVWAYTISLSVVFFGGLRICRASWNDGARQCCMCIRDRRALRFAEGIKLKRLSKSQGPIPEVFKGRYQCPSRP